MIKWIKDFLFSCDDMLKKLCLFSLLIDPHGLFQMIIDRSVQIEVQRLADRKVDWQVD